ncbi:tail fiber domain-containing protein, partial [bacterium]|nr:tail fiber domain-containing protein [bacterium]
MRLDSSGRLGIGTTTAYGPLSINNSAAPATSGNINSGLVVHNGTTGTAINLGTNDSGGYSWIKSSYVNNADIGTPLAFFVGANERFRCDTSGRLLVGTSSARANFFNSTASSIFQVEGNLSGGSQGQATLVANNDQLGAISFAGADGTEFVEGARIQAFVDGAPGADDMPGRLVFSVTRDGQSSPSEAMRITSAGNVLIGTNDTTSVAKFWVNGLGGLDHCARFQGTPSSGSLAQFVDLNTSGTHRAALFVKNFNEVGTITMTTSATAYNTSSDYRLKENIVPLTGASARLNQLQVHRFNFIAEPSKTVDGFLAHEAQAVVPECVTGIKDEVDDKGNPVYQGIDQSKLVPLLTAALQEALAEIESLKARVT